MGAIDAAVRDRAREFVATLLESVRIPSVCLTGQGIGEAVDFLVGRLAGWGFGVQVFPTANQPIVYAEIGPEDAAFTWLTYGHYDVYPADAKADGWKTDPWQPVVDGDRIWGRGAGDNKGQHLALLHAIALYRELHAGLPIRIKVILEGDEETGSRPLPGFVEGHRDMLRADLCCFSDGPMFPNDQPVLLMGVRGVPGSSSRPRARSATSTPATSAAWRPTPPSTSSTFSPRWWTARGACSSRAPATPR